MDTRIYVMTHKKIEEIPDPMYIPMQVGKKGKEDLGYAGDDTKDHISEKNPFYCELTGIYWLWKNADCDVIGICHYRRYFVKDEKLLTKDYIEKTMQNYSVILPSSSCVKDENAYTHYAKRHYGGDLDLCRTVISEKYPAYLPAFDYAMETILVSVGNMWITKKSIFDRYCGWLFDILFEVEKRLHPEKYDDYQKRVMGFLAERLFRVWLLMQPETVTEEEMKLIDPSDFLNAEKRVSLLYQCVKLKIEPLLRLYRTGAMTESLAQPLDCPDDFGGKIPVFVCWWQGEEDMPEVVRGCIRSLKENLPKEQTELRLITLENCRNYVTFTETVLQKFREGKISYTHLSDLLRAELLFRYGGMWVDATYYVTGPIEKDFFRQKIFTLRFQTPLWETDITKGRWSGNLWYITKGHKLFQFLMESFWYYWEVEDKLLDYYLIDYMIQAAWEEFPEIRNEIEQCGCSKNTVFLLHSWMNRKYLPERIERLRRESRFYKLNWKSYYRKENMAGEKTIYGYLFGTQQ